MHQKARTDFNEFINYLNILGHPASKERDDHGYQAIDEFICGADFPKKWLLPTVEILASEDFLFNTSENANNIPILKRSFSMLVLVSLVASDYTDTSMEKDNLYDMLIKLDKYIKFESEWCGHSKSYGWIHNMAHLGDLMGVLAGHPVATNDFYSKVCDSIQDLLIKTKNISFRTNELSRLGRVGAFLLLYGDVNTLGDKFKQMIKTIDACEYSEQHNFKEYLRNTYFHISIYKKDVSESDRELYDNALSFLHLCKLEDIL